MVANRDYKRIEIIYQDASEIDAKLEVYKEFGWELAFFTDDKDIYNYINNSLPNTS